MRICWFWTFLSFEVDFPALKFQSQEIYTSAIPKSELSDHQSHHCENKFHQYDSTVHLHFISGAQESTNVAVLVAFHSPTSPKFLQHLVPVFLRRKCQILGIFEDSGVLSFLSKGPFKYVSWSTHNVPWVVRQSRIATMHVSETRNGRGLSVNVGRSRAARCFSQNSFPSDQQLTHKRRQLMKYLHVSLDLLLHNRFSSIPQFLGNLLLDVLGRVFSLFSNLHTSRAWSAQLIRLL